MPLLSPYSMLATDWSSQHFSLPSCLRLGLPCGALPCNPAYTQPWKSIACLLRPASLLPSAEWLQEPAVGNLAPCPHACIRDGHMERPCESLHTLIADMSCFASLVCVSEILQPSVYCLRAMQMQALPSVEMLVSRMAM